MEIEELIELLREISNKLDRNNETLQKLYDETRRSNIALLNFREENPKIVRTSLSQIDLETIYTGSHLFVAYSRQELLEFMQKAAERRGGAFVYSRKIVSPGDLAGRINSCQAGDVILFDLDEVYRVQEEISLLVDVIEEKRTYIAIGKERHYMPGSSRDIYSILFSNGIIFAKGVGEQLKNYIYQRMILFDQCCAMNTVQ